MAGRQIAPLMEAAVAGDRQTRTEDLLLYSVLLWSTTLTEITEGKDQAGRHDGENQIDKICRRQLGRALQRLIALAVTNQGCFPAGIWHAVRITVLVDQN